MSKVLLLFLQVPLLLQEMRFFLYYHRCYCCHCHSSYYLSSNPANGADTTDSLSAASVTTDVTEGGTVTYLSVSIAATA